MINTWHSYQIATAGNPRRMSGKMCKGRIGYRFQAQNLHRAMRNVSLWTSVHKGRTNSLQLTVDNQCHGGLNDKMVRASNLSPHAMQLLQIGSYSVCSGGHVRKGNRFLLMSFRIRIKLRIRYQIDGDCMQYVLTPFGFVLLSLSLFLFLLLVPAASSAAATRCWKL